MILIPAIDIKDGRCVRLQKGQMDAVTVYSDDPLDVAKRWQGEGAVRLHIVDLDGAIAGHPVHFDRIRGILEGVSLPIQVGGGIRQMGHIENYIAAGAAAVILGTSMLQNEAFAGEAAKRFPGQIIAGIDCQQGRVAIRGWVALSDQKPAALAQRMQEAGLAAMIVTDIEKDGMLSGPNFDLFCEMAQAVKLPLIASGGITTTADIQRLHKMNIFGAILGKTLYSGALSFKDASRALEASDAH